MPYIFALTIVGAVGIWAWKKMPDSAKEKFWKKRNLSKWRKSI